MSRSFTTLLAALILVGSLVSPACKKEDKGNLSITFCNGGMVPDSLTFSETNLEGSNYIWQLFDANGSALSQPTSSAALASVVVRFDSAGTYRMRVDVDNEHSAEVKFVLKDFISEGTLRGVSFFDSDQTVWTVYPDNDCHAAVRVKQPNGDGGIDYYEKDNKLIYVPFSIITCFPNGVDLEEFIADDFQFRDLVVVQNTGDLYIGGFDFETGNDVILQTTVEKIPALGDGISDDRFVVSAEIKQLTFDSIDRVFYFVNDGTPVFIRDATQGAQTDLNDFGSSLEKTAVVYDIDSRRLIFAEGVLNCNIVVVDPVQPGTRLLEISVPCQGRIIGLDLDEATSDMVYTDGENVWMFDLDNPTVSTPLILGYNRTIRKDVLDFNVNVTPPIRDVVIARYRD